MKVASTLEVMKVKKGGEVGNNLNPPEGLSSGSTECVARPQAVRTIPQRPTFTMSRQSLGRKRQKCGHQLQLSFGRDVSLAMNVVSTFYKTEETNAVEFGSQAVWVMKVASTMSSLGVPLTIQSA